MAIDVERLTTNFSGLSLSLRYPSAATTRVYSSPSGTPISLTKAKRSASGSIAKPASALFFITASHKSVKF